VNVYRSDAYGVPTSSQGAINQHFLYTGQERDEDGLVLLRGRVYNPTLGRFLRRDPLGGSPGQPLSLNRYAYAGNNPTSATDPSGLLTSFIGGIGGSQYPASVQALQGNLKDVQSQVYAVVRSSNTLGG
jgi:RHS repeat-associated protein